VLLACPSSGALFLTIGWNVVEGIIAVTAGVIAGSVALLGFGIDSFVECVSGGVLVWRLRAESEQTDADTIERVERRALKLVGVSLFLLGGYLLFDSVLHLIEQKGPERSLVGIVLTSLSVGVMQLLARAKRRVAIALGSRALAADAFQTTACWWISVTVLLGLGAHALFGWWWVDPAAALVIVVLVTREGVEAWRGTRDCC
jgi:cation diffusion facilitator family transporter